MNGKIQSPLWHQHFALEQESCIFLSSLTRPRGFVLKSRTAGAYFSVGKANANMVHGGSRTSGFMHDDVVRMLVLTSDSEIFEVEGDNLK